MEDLLAGVNGWSGGGRVEESKTQEVKGHNSGKFFLLPFVCKDGYKGIGKEKMTFKIFSDFCWNNWTYHAHLLAPIPTSCTNITWHVYCPQHDVKSIFKLVDVDRSGWVSRSVSFVATLIKWLKCYFIKTYADHIHCTYISFKLNHWTWK